MIITIIPDTNIFINSLDVINHIVSDEHPYNIRVLVLSIILKELDKLKKDIKGARDAISFIKDCKSDKLHIEGSVNDRSMEVIDEVSTYNHKNIPADLLIVEKAAILDHSIVLTADKNMILFCKSQNVKSIFVSNMTYDQLKVDIYLAHTDMEQMDIVEDDIVCDKKLAEECLKPVVLKIIKEEIGPGVSLYKEKIDSFSIEQLVNFIIKNFDLFENFIPRSSKSIFIKCNEELKKKGDVKRTLQNILTVFRINYKL